MQWDIPTLTLTEIIHGLSSENTSVALNFSPGSLTARDDLILELDPSVDLFAALELHNDKWNQGRKLLIYGNKFIQTKDFIRGGHSAFYVNDYINPRYKLTGNALEFHLINPPLIGSSNDQIATIRTIKDPKKLDYQDNRLSMTIQKGDVTLSYAISRGRQNEAYPSRGKPYLWKCSRLKIKNK